MTAVVDAHVHYWQVSRGDYRWMTPDLPIHRDFLPADGAPLFDAAGIGGIVLVQAADTEAETRFMLSLARADARVRGVVGWTDMEAPDAPDRLAALAADPLLRGIRPMWQDIPDVGWFLHPRQDPAYRTIAALGLTFDALARVRHLPLLPKLIERHPDLPLVIDHGAKPEIAAGRFEPWRRDMAVLASFPHVHCKLSGLVTEAAPGAPPASIARYAEALLELFGPQRLMFGSDWPVVTLRCGYADWWNQAHQLAAYLPQADRDDLFGGTAERFYRLPDRAGAA